MRRMVARSSSSVGVGEVPVLLLEEASLAAIRSSSELGSDEDDAISEAGEVSLPKPEKESLSWSEVWPLIWLDVWSSSSTAKLEPSELYDAPESSLSSSSSNPTNFRPKGSSSLSDFRLIWAPVYRGSRSISSGLRRALFLMYVSHDNSI